MTNRKRPYSDTELKAARSDLGLLRAVVSRRVKLRRSGNCWKGICPFHDDRNPSFAIYEGTHFNCFGCEQRGNVFDFVMLSEGVSFLEAAERVLGERGSILHRRHEHEDKHPLDEEWCPMTPAPSGARARSADLECDMLHEYRDLDGRLLFYIRRYEAKGKRAKQFLPLTYGRLKGVEGWHSKAIQSARPLYGLDRLGRAPPDATVILCEGEKAADAAQRLFPEMVAMTWMGGAGSENKSDFSPLSGRQVALWPDADQPGRTAMERLSGQLNCIGIVDTTGLEDKFDAANLEADKEVDPHEWLASRLSPAARDPVVAVEIASGAVEHELAPQIWIYRDPTEIPPREWLIGNLLLRGYATVLASSGGVGKTAYSIALALAFITGRRDIIDQHVFQTGKVWIFTLEDDRTELERRVAAGLIAHRISPKQVEGRLFINAAADRPLILATAEPDGSFKVSGDVGQLTEQIAANDIGLVIIDPLVKSHRVIENSNEHMDQLIGLTNQVARESRCAVLLAAHFRKGSSEHGARDSVRGGGALIDGARIVRTLTPLDKESAQNFGIAEDDAWRYVQIQDAKANLSFKAASLWFELVSIPLGNSGLDPAYPAGDHIQAARAWQPPSLFEGLGHVTLGKIFGRLRAQPEQGWFFSPDPRAKFWAGQVIVDETKKDKKQAASVLKIWVENGLLEVEPYTTPNRNDGQRIVVNELKVVQILAACT